MTVPSEPVDQVRPTPGGAAEADLSIQRAAPADAAAIYALLVACGRAMAARSYPNWDPPPTSVGRLREDAVRGGLLVARAPDGEVVGTAVLGPAPSRPYEADVRAGRVTWGAPAATAWYANRLAVHPAWQGRGPARQLLRAVEAEARAAGAAAVRFDALAGNAALNAYYERLGCRRCGTRSHSGWTFAVFERLL